MYHIGDQATALQSHKWNSKDIDYFEAVLLLKQWWNKPVHLWRIFNLKAYTEPGNIFCWKTYFSCTWHKLFVPSPQMAYP